MRAKTQQRQTRLDVNYSQAAVKVVIDFIRFRIETPDGPIERSEHDVDARDLDARIRRLKERYGAISDPVPVGLEVAMDVFIPGDDLDTLAEIGADLWRMNTVNVSPNQRAYGDRNTSRPAATPTALKKLVREIRAGRQIAEGNNDDPVYKHLYLKLTDDAGRTKRRPSARLEFRLQGDACPFGALNELRGFDWRELRDLFRFRQLREDLDDLRMTLADNSDRIGKRKTRARVSQSEMRAKGTREFSRLTTSNTTLNRKADASLVSLTRSWKALRTQVKDAALPGNLEQFSPESRASTGIGRITTLSNLDRIASQPSQPTQASAASAAKSGSASSLTTVPSQPNQPTDEALRPVPASPSPAALAIPVTSETADAMTEPTEPRRGDRWHYPDPW